jgi:hypothetical protein
MTFAQFEAKGAQNRFITSNLAGKGEKAGQNHFINSNPAGKAPAGRP